MTRYVVINKTGLVLSRVIRGGHQVFDWADYDSRNAVEYPSQLAAERGGAIYGGTAGIVSPMVAADTVPVRVKKRLSLVK